MKKTLSYIGLILILILGLTSCVKKEDENYANQTKANTVITEINQLPTTDAIELTDEVKVANVRSLYNALSKEAKALVTNLDKLEALENKLIELKKAKDNQDKANVVIELINKLPAADELTLEGEDKVKEARTSYEALSEEVKALVTNLDKLEALENKLIELKKAKDNQDKANVVIELINKLPTADELTLEGEDKVKEARTAYEALSEEVKALVTNLSKLEALENKLIELKKAEDNQDKANVVIELINKLPALSNLNLEDESKLKEARTAYEALSEEVKALVINLGKLEALEDKMKELIEDKKLHDEATMVVAAIDNLPNVELITLDAESAIVNARNAYNSLAPKAKALVTNLNKLIALENKIKELKEAKENQTKADAIINLIDKLPALDKLTLDDEEEVVKVRNAYNALEEKIKNLVSNLDKLIAVENKLEELKSSLTSYEVILYPNEGRIEGLDKGSSPKLNYQFTLNYYSTGFFAVYKTDVVVMKTSLIKETDSYTYALKIGFSFDSSKNAYVVNQIIKSGTGLTSESKTAEYYILVHSDNATAYQELSSIELGDVIYSNKDFPNEANQSLDANITIYDATEVDEAEYYVVSYKGLMALPVPVKTGYAFQGWYDNEECIGEAITSVSSAKTLYAKWIVDQTQIDPNDVLSCISDVATSNTVDNLITKIDDVTYSWSSSNPNLYVIENGKGTVSKVYQTHKTQEVTITATGKNPDGTTFTKSKKIIVNPVLYDELPNTPVATYFSTSAMYAYKQYNERYKASKTIFSENTKKILNIIYYSFAVIDSEGNCTVSDTSYLGEVRALKANNTRIIISINGVSAEACKNFADITGDAAKRANFVNNLMNMVEKYNFDGIDIDWETVSSTNKVVSTSLNALMKELRAEMTKRQAENGTPYFLSAAVPASTWGTASDRFDFKTLNNYVDYINLMSYDLNNGQKTSHLSPLYSSSNDGGYGFGCAWGVERLVSLGLSRNKVIIGSAGYGKAYRVTGTSTNTTYPSLGVSGTLTAISGIPGSFASGTVFGNGIKALIDTGNYKKYLEYNNKGQLVGAYLYNSADNIFVTYDSEEVIMAKYKYAASQAGVGIMCWCYSEDTSDNYVNSIYKAIYN